MEVFSWDKEVKRQAVHISGSSLALIYIFSGKSPALALSIFGALISILIYFLFRRRSLLAVRLVEVLEREESLRKFPAGGAIFYFTGVSLSIALFPGYIVPAIILVTTVGDAFSTLVGLRWGSIKLPYNREKSLQGSAAFLATAFLASSLAAPYQIALVGSLAGALAESIATGGGEDNLLVPLSAGVLMQLSLCSGFIL